MLKLALLEMNPVLRNNTLPHKAVAMNFKISFDFYIMKIIYLFISIKYF